jgi:ADP-heptose:LPS heptosyltransferase
MADAWQYMIAPKPSAIGPAMDSFDESRTSTTPIDAVVRRSGSVLATFYAGIGDAINHGPILRALVSCFGNRLVMPESRGIEILNLIPELRTIRIVPAVYRKLYVIAPEAAVKVLASADITTILNFRRDRTVDPLCYGGFAATLAANHVLHFDVCERVSTPEQLTMHTAELSRRLARALGLDCPVFAPGWLRPFVGHGKAQRDDRIGFFLGASVRLKRPSVRFWSTTISTICSGLSSAALLIAGCSREEQHFAHLVSCDLTRAGIPHSSVSRLSLTDLASLIAILRGLVTPDTFALPLAEALNTPVVGVFVATDCRVYGTQHSANAVVTSSYYSKCPSRNTVGNCDAWDTGCSHLTCHSHLEPDGVFVAVQNAIVCREAIE